jgi:hypothetical protein
VLRFKSQCESSDFYLRELQQNPEEDDDAQKDCEENSTETQEQWVFTSAPFVRMVQNRITL